MLDYVVKATLHMHKGAQRQQHKEDQITHGWATPKPIRGSNSPSKSHLHNTEEHSIAQWKAGAQIHSFWGTNFLSRTLPEEPPGVKPIPVTGSSSWDHLWYYGKLGNSWLGHNGMQEEGHFGSHRTICRMFRGGDDLIWRSVGKIEGQEVDPM